jgi:hypothetical protein
MQEKFNHFGGSKRLLLPYILVIRVPARARARAQCDSCDLLNYE